MTKTGTACRHGPCPGVCSKLPSSTVKRGLCASSSAAAAHFDMYMPYKCPVRAATGLATAVRDKSIDLWDVYAPLPPTRPSSSAGQLQKLPRAPCTKPAVTGFNLQKLLAMTLISGDDVYDAVAAGPITLWPAGNTPATGKLCASTAWRFDRPYAKRTAVGNPCNQGLEAFQAAMQIGEHDLFMRSGGSDEGKKQPSSCQRLGQSAVLKAAGEGSWQVFEAGAIVGQAPLYSHGMSLLKHHSSGSAVLNLFGAAFGLEALVTDTDKPQEYEVQQFLKFGVPGLSTSAVQAAQQSASIPMELNAMAPPILSAALKSLKYRCLRSIDAEAMIVSLRELKRRGVCVGPWAWSSAWYVLSPGSRTRLAGLAHQLPGVPFASSKHYDLAAEVLMAPSLGGCVASPKTHQEAVTWICGAIAEMIGFADGRAKPCGLKCCGCCKGNVQV